MKADVIVNNPNPSDPDPVGEREAMEELDRLLADTDFQASERNKRFLRFICEEYFLGRTARIKAYCIAVDVFGRPSNFDPAIDPIVRIEATRLRSSLSRYYELRRKKAHIHIELPAGRYIPVFSRQMVDRSADYSPSWELSQAERSDAIDGPDAYRERDWLGLLTSDRCLCVAIGGILGLCLSGAFAAGMYVASY